MSPQEIRAKLNIQGDKPAGFFDAPLTKKAGSFIKEKTKSPEAIRQSLGTAFNASKKGAGSLYNSYLDYAAKNKQATRDKLNLPSWLEDTAATAKLGLDMGLFLPRGIAAGAVSLTKEVNERAGLPSTRSKEEQLALEQKLFNRPVPSISEGYVDPAVGFAEQSGSGSLEKFGIGTLAFGLGFLAENPYTGRAAPVRKWSKSFLDSLAKEASEAEVARILKKELPELSDTKLRSTLSRSIATEKSPTEIQRLINNARRVVETDVARKAGNAEAPQVLIAKNIETGKDTVFRVRAADVNKVREAVEASKNSAAKPRLVSTPVADLLDRGFENGGFIGRKQVDTLTKQVDELTGKVDDLTKPTLKSPSELRAAVSNQPRTADGRFGFKPNKEAETARAGRAGVKEPDNLVAVHNIREDNLRKSQELGGLAKPSLAILDPKKSQDVLNNFGEVSLVAPKELVDPRGGQGARVFGADVYSPRFPDAVTRFRSAADEKRVNKTLADVFRKYVPEDTAKFVGLDADALDTEFETNPAVLMRFLEDRGIEPKIDLSKIDPTDTDFSKRAEVRNQLMSQIRKEIGIEGREVQDFARKLLDELDATDTKLLAGRTPMGRQKFIEYSMDNALRLMGRAVRDVEGYNYGLASYRANFTPQFKSLKQIKDAQGRIVSPTEFNRIKEEVDAEYMDLIDEFGKNRREGLGDSNQFIQFDRDAEAMRDYGLGSRDSWITDNYDVTPELDRKISAFNEKLKTLPTEYFEIKYNRAVDVGEFKAAVVPEDISKDVEEYLEYKGLELETYKPDDKGLNRVKALKNVVDRRDGLAFAGGVVGVEQDEEGNVVLDPVTALGGMLGLGLFSRVLRGKGVFTNMMAHPKYWQVESEIFAEFDIAEAGTRVFGEEGVTAIPSTFPKWIPEHLREKKLMDRTLRHIAEGTEPKASATRQKELYDVITEEFQQRLGKYEDAYTEIPEEVLRQWDDDAAGIMKDTTEKVRNTVSNVDLEGKKLDVEKIGNTPIKNTPRKAQSASQGEFNFFEIPEETRLDKIRRTLQDKFRRLEVIQKAVDPKTTKIKEDADAFLQQELYVGRTAERIDKMREEVIFNPRNKGTGLLERMRKDDITVEDLGRYMHAKHATERNAQVRKINEELPDGGSGLTDAQAKEILAEFKDNKGIQKYADEFREKVIKERIRILREEGLMTEEALEKIETFYTDYVPLKVADKTTRLGASGKGFSAQGKDIKRVKGSTKERSNPVMQAIVDLEDTIIKAEKNKVGQSFLKLVRQNPNKDLWEVESLKYAPRYNKEGEVIMLDPKYKFADNVMEVREGGKVRLITIKDKELARAMKNLGTEKAVSKVLMAFNSYLRGVVTFYNPEFMLTNFQRDIQTALINVGGEKSVGLAKNVAKEIAPAMRGIYRDVRGKKPAVKKKGTDWQALYNEMKEEGGRVGWFDLNEVGERTKETIKLINRYNSDGSVDSLRRGIDSVGKLVSDMNESVEMAVRLSTYKNLTESGMSKAKAAQYAKNLTVNFNKKGNWGVALNSLYLFANAGIQGSARILTALKYPKVRAIVGGIAASAYAINHLNEAINEEGYNRLSDFEKDTNLIFMLPPDFKPSSEEKKFIGGNDKDGYYLKLRQPYGYNIFKVFGDSAYNLTSGKKTVGEEMKHLMLAMDTAFNPLSSGSLLQFASPTISDPVVQQLENKNWFGSPIKPDQPAYQPEVRESSLYFKGATEQSKAVTEWLNRVTGGNEVEAGFIDISPEIIDHYVDFIGGGVGNLLNATVDTSITLAEGDLPDVDEMPFVRKFVDKPFEQKEKFEMYDLLDKSATSKLAPVQRKRFLDDVGIAIETEQIDEETGKKVLREFMKNEAKIKAGEIFSLYQEGKKEEAVKAASEASPFVDAAFRKLVEDEVKKRLEERLETVNN